MNRDWLEEGFRESLNDQFGSAHIAGHTYKAADLLKAIDKYHYDILFNDYMMEMRELRD